MVAQGEEQAQAIVKQGVASGEFSSEINPAVAGAMIVAVLRGITVQTILIGSDVDGDFVAELKRGLLAGLTAGDRPPGTD